MESIKIIGGNPISGTVTPVTNKNAVLKMIAAAVLTTEDVVLQNVPKTSDVRNTLKLFERLGGNVEYSTEKMIRLNAANINSTDIGTVVARANLVFLGPLIGRFGEAHMIRALGCDLGIRQTDTHFDNFKKMGADVVNDDTGLHVYLKENKGGFVWQEETAVTPTENLIFLAVKAKGHTTIYNAASEPHIQDLCKMLNQMGAKISGISTNRLEIDGVDELHGTDYTPGNDHIDIGGLIGVAAMTNGELLIKDAEVEHMSYTLWVYEKLGVRVEIQGNDIFVPKNQKLEIDPTFTKNEIQVGPWPKFPADLMPTMVPVALSAKGSIVMHNWMYETGLLFTEELKKFGAKLIIADPHRVITYGPTKFQGANIHSPYIIQAAMACFYTALAAEGESILTGVAPIERRFEDFLELYTGLGANIEILS